MAFTVRDYQDLTRLLAQHPEWQAELRRLLLSEDFLALPGIVRDLAEAQQRHEERLAGVEERLVGVEERLAGVEERLARLETSVQELTQQMRVLVLQVQNLAEAQQQTTDRLGQVVGDLLELRYREHAAGYFGRYLRRARAVSPVELEERLEQTLSHDELMEVLRLDLLVNGRLRDRPDAPEVWLAVEVAAVLDEADVERAQRRAALLRKADYWAIPVVAGEGVNPGATALLQDASVVLVLDGRSQGWEEALGVA